MPKTELKKSRFDMRVSKSFVRMIEDWRRRQYPAIPSKTEAIEFLCQAAIEAGAKFPSDEAAQPDAGETSR